MIQPLNSIPATHAADDNKTDKEEESLRGASTLECFTKGQRVTRSTFPARGVVHLRVMASSNLRCINARGILGV